MVNKLLDAGIATVGPTKEGAQIEWDKDYSMQLVADSFPDVAPKFWTVYDKASLNIAIEEIRLTGVDIVVKPQGLTAGKGVKVMGAHLDSLDSAADYAEELLTLRPDECVLLVEKVVGVEYTIMFLTDGEKILRVPTTYDYPYRFEGDTGPGTGGMGAFSVAGECLPFMSQSDYDLSVNVAEKILSDLKASGRHFNGVLNAGFFVTKNGLKFLEFNARFGDPECMNIMTVLESSAVELFEQIASGCLDVSTVRFSNEASVVKYLVTPEYALKEGVKHAFHLDVASLASMGVATYFSAGEHFEDKFVSVGNSRCVALAAKGITSDAASQLIEKGIRLHFNGNLEWRRDIGTSDYIASLTV